MPLLLQIEQCGNGYFVRLFVDNQLGENKKVFENGNELEMLQHICESLEIKDVIDFESEPEQKEEKKEPEMKMEGNKFFGCLDPNSI